ncbi:hypothetical protein K505DRAFT_130154 [Melanomma pulvis-pyrius CBS 109.77]|uniref:Uncharacterized protein n=1 Tax=Melanomma pulvis-pyrius CBS 109.77 TaxID=1314802 RepID=A0A6A6WTN6_9PLEO|nr:hypothetical protein K505DRAFT_130154 [Melanomma pulvis-pyrius CBS 109.77]
MLPETSPKPNPHCFVAPTPIRFPLPPWTTAGRVSAPMSLTRMAPPTINRHTHMSTNTTKSWRFSTPGDWPHAAPTTTFRAGDSHSGECSSFTAVRRAERLADHASSSCITPSWVCRGIVTPALPLISFVPL